jgi:3-oxoacyl-[acyl-carrier-protein] synthase-3
MNINLIGLSHRVGSIAIEAGSIEDRFEREPGTIQGLCGVTRLHHLSPEEDLVTLAAEASIDALKDANVPLSRVDGIFSSCNPTTDYLIPSLAPMVAAKLDISHVMALNIGMGCAGGVQALQAAYNQLVVDALNKRVSYYLVAVGDHISRMINHASWKTAILFSDGISVAVVTNDPARTDGFFIDSVRSETYAGEHVAVINLPNILAREEPGERASYMLQMRGRGVFEFGTRIVPRVKALCGIESFEKSFIIPHQANLRMLNELIPAFEITPEQLYVDGITKLGNISGAACFLGLEDARDTGRLDGSENILLCAFGAELQVAVAVLRKA